MIKWNSYYLAHDSNSLKFNDIGLHINSSIIKPTNHARNLWFIMDSLLKNGPHINKITSSCYCKLCNIAKIRPYLDTKSAQLIVQALVLSNINYCNSLLAGSSQYQLNKLQHIQNMGCQVICNIRKHNHVSPAMKHLHWLRIPVRITYKLCLLVYKYQNNLAPKYLSDLLPSNPSSRDLRSSQSDNIYASCFKNSQCKHSSFSSAGPRAWNFLPTVIKNAQSLHVLRLYFKLIYLTFLITSNLYFIILIYLTFYLF